MSCSRDLRPSFPKAPIRWVKGMLRSKWFRPHNTKTVSCPPSEAPFGCICDQGDVLQCWARTEALTTAKPAIEQHNAYLECHSSELPVGCLCPSKGGFTACKHLNLKYLLEGKIGATIGAGFFSDSPQRFAINNRHLPDYFAGRQRAMETTPYEIPASQMHLLPHLGMENPQPDAPRVPHGLHKAIEEGQLRRLRRVLTPHGYGIISVKTEKLHLLPPTNSHQNPVYEAKDVSRYPGTAIGSANLRDKPVYLMHDISSVVTPHELVEKLVSENEEAQLFVTGINPIEVIDSAGSFEPASHRIEYDLGGFNYIFTDSESESYFTPVSTTNAWLRTSSVCASNGRVYHVTLLEYKLGHCVWHIYCGQGSDQHTRTFSTGSYVQLPAAITGTLGGEYLPAKLVSSLLSFVDFTTDLSARNLAAKATQLANAINPKTTSKERWIARHIAEQRYFKKTFWFLLKRAFWNTLYLFSFQWQMLRELPDIYSYLEETKRTRTLHPTPGGGWTPNASVTPNAASIPNNPSMLQKLSAFTGAVFTFLLPKIIIGEFITEVLIKIDFISIVKHLWTWADIKPFRLLLTIAIVAVTAILPGSVVKVFSRLAGHFWRQLWLPGWVTQLIPTLITELTGSPGYRFLYTLPGRGWFYQLHIWSIGVASLLPGLMDFLFPGWWNPWFLPWCAIYHPATVWLLGAWYLLIILENACALLPERPFPVYATTAPVYHHNMSYYIGALRDERPTPRLSLCLDNTFAYMVHHPLRLTYSAINWLFVVRHRLFSHQANTGNCGRVANLAGVPQLNTPTVRQRHVDQPLPAIVVRPANIPVANPLVALGVDPLGLDFADFLNQVQAAYNANPNAYPLLAPGMDCFWRCLSSLGGSTHMWYSWFLARMGRAPNPADPTDGSVTLADIQVFSAVSHIGVNLNGLAPQVSAPAAGWPTLHITLGRSVVPNLLHVELTNLAAPNVEVQALARIIKTCSEVSPQWFQHIQNVFNAGAMDSVPTARPFLSGVAGIHAMPNTRAQVLDAIVASAHANPILPGQGDGYAWDATAIPALHDSLFDYNAPVVNQRIAHTTPRGLWQTFRGIGKRFRLRSDILHPVAEPEMKIGATTRENRTNRATHNRRPEVPGYVSLANDLAIQLAQFKDLELPVVPLRAERTSFTADVRRAARLISDLRANPAVLGPFGSTINLQSLDSIIDLHKASGKTVQVPMTLYLGVSGCGKTVETAKYLKSLPEDERLNARIVSHTEELRAEAKEKLDFQHFRGFNFPTLASIITEPSSGPVVFDDAGCVWAGLVDLVVLSNPLLTEIVINGDAPQGLAKFPVRGGQSEHDESVIVTVSRQATTYATLSHRLFGLLADSLGVHTTNPVYGHITHSVGPKVGIPTCTASPRYAGVLASAGRDAYTYDSVQGKDFDEEVEIDATGLEGAILDRTGYVALTRSKKGIYLRLDAANPTNVVKTPPTGSNIINALVYSMRQGGSSHLIQPNWLIKAAFYNHLAGCMPLLPWFASIGASVPPGLASLIAPICPTSEPVEGTVVEHQPEPVQVSADPHHQHEIQESHWVASEFRELPVRGSMTSQFKSEGTVFVNPHVHTRNDTPTYKLSVEARLKVADRAENRRRQRLTPRTELKSEYDKLVPAPPRWNAEKHARYIDLAWEEYTSKRTFKAVLDKLMRHNPGRTGSDILISLKAQVIKKDEKRHKLVAIPGQLIHEYDILQTINDAAYALFLENEIIPAFPKRFLFYRRMNPQQFRAAYRELWRVDNGAYSSDVTRWDVGCDAALLNFDTHVFRRSGLPEEFLAAYERRRLGSRCQHGPLATMQNSGDRFTWPLNTVRRAVVTSWACELTEDDCCAVNGDDAAVDRFCHTRQLPDSPWLFKDVNGATVEFSGYELGGREPTYSASGLWYRTMILISRNPTAQDKWVNYMTLLADCDLDHPMAAAVADQAHIHMDKEAFALYLPEALRRHYPDRFSFE